MLLPLDKGNLSRYADKTSNHWSPLCVLKARQLPLEPASSCGSSGLTSVDSLQALPHTVHSGGDSSLKMCRTTSLAA